VTLLLLLQLLLGRSINTFEYFGTMEIA